MRRRIAKVMLVALVAALLSAPTIFAAPPYSSQQGVWKPAPWQARWESFPVWPGQARPVNGLGLGYKLDYSTETNQLILTVYNPTRKPIVVTAPNGRWTDFVLWQDDTVVYRSSYGKGTGGAPVRVTFAAGEGKMYKETLPANLPAGVFEAQAYFLGETKWAPVASTYVVRRGYTTSDPLKYSVEYMAPSMFNAEPRLRVTITNTSQKDVTLPYQYGYQVLVRKPGAKDYRGDVGIGQSIGTIQAGASRYVFVTLKGLPRGEWEADVRSNVGSGTYRIVAETWFYIR